MNVLISEIFDPLDPHHGHGKFVGRPAAADQRQQRPHRRPATAVVGSDEFLAVTVDSISAAATPG